MKSKKEVGVLNRCVHDRLRLLSEDGKLPLGKLSFVYGKIYRVPKCERNKLTNELESLGLIQRDGHFLIVK